MMRELEHEQLDSGEEADWEELGLEWVSSLLLQPTEIYLIGLFHFIYSIMGGGGLQSNDQNNINH